LWIRVQERNIEKGDPMRRKIAVRGLVSIILICVYSSAQADFCEYADKTYAKVATSAAGLGVAAGAGAKALGLTAVAHSSGAAIAYTASTGYLAGTLGALGTAVGVITTPAVLIVGGVAVTAAGGAIAYCHYSKDEKPSTLTESTLNEG